MDSQSPSLGPDSVVWVRGWECICNRDTSILCLGTGWFCSLGLSPCFPQAPVSPACPAQVHPGGEPEGKRFPSLRRAGHCPPPLLLEATHMGTWELPEAQQAGTVPQRRQQPRFLEIARGPDLDSQWPWSLRCPRSFFLCSASSTSQTLGSSATHAHT